MDFPQLCCNFLLGWSLLKCLPPLPAFQHLNISEQVWTMHKYKIHDGMSIRRTTASPVGKSEARFWNTSVSRRLQAKPQASPANGSEMTSLGYNLIANHFRTWMELLGTAYIPLAALLPHCSHLCWLSPNCNLLRIQEPFLCCPL